MVKISRLRGHSYIHSEPRLGDGTRRRCWRYLHIDYFHEHIITISHFFITVIILVIFFLMYNIYLWNSNEIGILYNFYGIHIYSSKLEHNVSVTFSILFKVFFGIFEFQSTNEWWTSRKNYSKLYIKMTIIFPSVWFLQKKTAINICYQKVFNWTCFKYNFFSWFLIISF